MIKIFNKICFHIKNIILPLTLVATIYIVMFMFKRLEKSIFGADLVEFILIILPFIILIILSLINLFFKQENIKTNTLYNTTSLLVAITISIFCYRALMDQNMLFWHKYQYKINFNYFADQIAAIKVMLYGLSLANIILMINNAIKTNESVELVNKSIKKKS